MADKIVIGLNLEDESDYHKVLAFMNNCMNNLSDYEGFSDTFNTKIINAYKNSDLYFRVKSVLVLDFSTSLIYTMDVKDCLEDVDGLQIGKDRLSDDGSIYLNLFGFTKNKYDIFSLGDRSLFWHIPIFFNNKLIDLENKQFTCRNTLDISLSVDLDVLLGFSVEVNLDTLDYVIKNKDTLIYYSNALFKGCEDEAFYYLFYEIDNQPWFVEIINYNIYKFTSNLFVNYTYKMKTDTIIVPNEIKNVDFCNRNSYKDKVTFVFPPNLERFNFSKHNPSNLFNCYITFIFSKNTDISIYRSIAKPYLELPRYAYMGNDILNSREKLLDFINNEILNIKEY